MCKYTSLGFPCTWLCCYAGCVLYKTTPCHIQAAQCEWYIEPCLRLCTWRSNKKLIHSMHIFMSNREVKEQMTEIRKRKVPLPLDPGCRVALLPHPHSCLTFCPPVPWCLFYAELLSYLTSPLFICILASLALLSFLLVSLLLVALQKSPMCTVLRGIMITAALQTLHLEAHFGKCGNPRVTGEIITLQNWQRALVFLVNFDQWTVAA